MVPVCSLRIEEQKRLAEERQMLSTNDTIVGLPEYYLAEPLPMTVPEVVNFTCHFPGESGSNKLSCSGVYAPTPIAESVTNTLTNNIASIITSSRIDCRLGTRALLQAILSRHWTRASTKHKSRRLHSQSRLLLVEEHALSPRRTADRRLALVLGDGLSRVSTGPPTTDIL
jgi:hypothetical protein